MSLIQIPKQEKIELECKNNDELVIEIKNKHNGMPIILKDSHGEIKFYPAERYHFIKKKT